RVGDVVGVDRLGVAGRGLGDDRRRRVGFGLGGLGGLARVSLAVLVGGAVQAVLPVLPVLPVFAVLPGLRRPGRRGVQLGLVSLEGPRAAVGADHVELARAGGLHGRHVGPRQRDD